MLGETRQEETQNQKQYAYRNDSGNQHNFPLLDGDLPHALPGVVDHQTPSRGAGGDAPELAAG